MITAALSACTLVPERPSVDQELQRQLRRVEAWQAQGKLGLRVDGDAHSAYFDWQNEKESFTLRLSGPFGQGTTWLRRRGRLVSLESPDRPIQQAATAELLMQEQLGWQVPVTNLRHWIKGVAAPRQSVTQVRHNVDGTLAELHQQGWHITYNRYKAYDGWVLPGKLVASRGSLVLTMVIKDWQLAPPEERPPLAAEH